MLTYFTFTSFQKNKKGADGEMALNESNNIILSNFMGKKCPSYFHAVPAS